LSVVPESRDTYRVKVYERVRHSSTTFPSANPPLANRALEPQTPRSRSRSRDPLSPDRLERLRQDPSVTSLLNILDQQGRTKVDAFSDTPKRKQSLRTLLGATSDPEDESDLSWAERLLESVIHPLRLTGTNYHTGTALPMVTLLKHRRLCRQTIFKNALSTARN
jgi:hypothetical protein